ncbi:MAG: 23S rRNA (pseudouridine(1915)-N(3))-methyltransferase RlmH [Rubrobacter sp.]
MIRRATIVAVGKPKGWAKDGADEYAKRLRRYFIVEIVEIPESDMNRLSPDEVLAQEAERIFKRLPDGAHVIALDRERGRQYPSEELASRQLVPLGASGKSHITFVLGGALGLAPEILGHADEAWSFGTLTLPHALARVVLLEQLYRAVKIHRGEKYHW